MKKIILTLLYLYFCFGQLLFSNVKGRVICQGKGVPNVSVTDGINTVQTDKKGKFTLPDTDEDNLIYYSLPSGYESPIIDGIPSFYKKKSASNNEIVFEINRSTIAQDKHTFAVWADPQVLNIQELELLKDVYADLQNTYQIYKDSTPFHAISCGDNVFDHLYLFDNYKGLFKDIEFPFYQVIGNHDLDYNERSSYKSDSTFVSEFGPTYYSYNRGRIHYVVLNDVFYYGDSYRYIGYIDEKQLKWLENDLKTVEEGSTIVVSLHIPTKYGDSKNPHSDISQMRNSLMNNKALYKILSKFNTHIMAGHSHIQWNTLISDSIFEHVHAAASGAWWQGDVGIDGTPKGYTIYEVNGDSISWYLKGLNKTKENQIKTYSVGSDSQHPTSFIANVFNFDPMWKVYWLENGVRIGEMQQYWGKDPYAALIYQPGKNKTHGWLSAGETNHLFKAIPQDPKAKISVQVIDRFGNQYTQEVESNRWQLVWQDEFDGKGLPDESKWSFDTAGNEWGWGNNEAQHYTKNDTRNANVDNGTLKIVAHIDSCGGKRYTSARLITKDKADWLYGKVEVRAKLPTNRGTWPAIWMLPTDWEYGNWPKSGEIDIMENVGYDPNVVLATAHTEKYNHVAGTQTSGELNIPTCHSEFHVYSLEWEKEEWRAYVDGVHYYTFRNDGNGFESWPFDKRFHLILNLAIGGNWGGKEGIDESDFPKTFEIDYVRVYQTIE